MNYTFNFAGLLPYWEMFLAGTVTTLELTLASTVFGLILGVLCAIGRRGQLHWLSAVCGIYIETVRNTPFLVQIFIFYFGLSSLGYTMSANLAAVIAMVINVGAYSAEIIRAGMDAVPRGRSRLPNAWDCRGPVFTGTWSCCQLLKRSIPRSPVNSS